MLKTLSPATSILWSVECCGVWRMTLICCLVVQHSSWHTSLLDGQTYSDVTDTL